MQLIYFLAFVSVLGAAYAQPIGEDQAKEAARLEDVADLGNAQPQEETGDRPRRWLWGGWGGISSGWGGGWSPGWGGGYSGGWGSGWGVSYRPWSRGSSYWW